MWKLTFFFLFSQYVFCNKCTGHISGKTYIFPCFFIFCIYTKPVCIRVCRKNYVCIFLFCKFKRKCPRFLVLRVRISNCRKVSVRLFLFPDNIDIFKSKFFKNSSDRYISRSVKRCIYDFYVFCSLSYNLRMNILFFKLCDILIINFFADNFDKSFGNCLLIWHCFHLLKIFNQRNLCQNIFVMRRCNLCSILPINFVAVVFSRIVACSYNNSGYAAKLSN